MNTTFTTGLPAGLGSAANSEEANSNNPVSAAARAAPAPARKLRRPNLMGQPDPEQAPDVTNV